MTEMTREWADAQLERAKQLHARRIEQLAQTKITHSAIVKQMAETRVKMDTASQMRMARKTFREIGEHIGCSLHYARELVSRAERLGRHKEPLFAPEEKFLADYLEHSTGERPSQITPEQVAAIVWMDAVTFDEKRTRKHFGKICRWLRTHGLKERPYNDTGRREGYAASLSAIR